MNTNRANMIAASFQSFSKETYYKREVLSELFALQKELVEKTFGEASGISELKIWDVERRLDEMNTECGGIVTEQLETLKRDCKCISNLIKAEISGNRGEAKAFDSLSRIRGEHIILKNIELSNDDTRSELDAVVLTRNGAFIIEVKNTSRDIFIDENGNYYRTGEFLKWDSHIGKKMETRKVHLRGVLDAKGLTGVPIYEIVVFTNSRIEVQNKCSSLQTCFLSQLPYIVNKYSNTAISTSEMELASHAISEANSEKPYPFDFDVEAFKMNFGNILATLENAKETKRNNRFRTLSSFFSRMSMKYVQKVAMVAAALTAMISTIGKG